MTTYKNFKIVAKLQGAEINKARNDNEPRNKYFVYITNMENGEKTRFTFWDSLNNTRRGVVLDGDNLLHAFYCFVSDANNGFYDFHDFCDEFGYDSNSITARKIYKSCCKSYEKWIRISGMNDFDFWDFLDELQEVAG